MRGVTNRVKYTVGFLATVAVHAAVIETRKRFVGIEPEFRQGSADDMVADSLRSGDVVLFSRKWYNYHLPTALLVKAQEAFYGGEYDHSGIIVMKAGTPYVLETTPIRGLQCRRFEERIRHSASSHIVVLTLNKSKSLSVQQDQQLLLFADQECATKASFVHSEIAGFAGGLCDYILKEVLKAKEPSGIYCPNVNLLERSFKSMDLGLRPKSSDVSLLKASIKDLHERKILVKATDSKIIQFFASDVHIRS